ncbi:peptide/nickel transport system substrate-binding protein [Enhydrobacter aerosaccus]|uniref:Peptide/nickel transport system substrate-binding protein n=1 Tax=Enhydrobacter aerosaccus TaxID=225324 RepID=A0A1T4RII4_9HYPH|nr:ABC transporter substrate-binding protein [Enhydrobacter aerosaccus]SKA15707.1 peptide/nickel transport system substrate-binding protein [Enhydrobacter aerosaccus]
MRLRSIAAALVAALLAACPTLAQTKTVRAVMHSDIKILDPIWTTANIVRNHGYMVWDTLFAMDEKLQVQPQMVDHWELSPDRLIYTFTLRDGLKWHDGLPVTSEDCIASLRRWGAKDFTGQKLLSFVSALEAVNDKTFRMVLTEPYGLVLDSLAKPGASVPFMMPKRIADTDPGTQITEIVGSGPFIFKKDEWKPGEKIVYVRNPDYKPRAEPPSGLAGGKVVKVDRVEWLAIPDHMTAVNALLAGEIDYIEAPPHDLLPLLKADRSVTVKVYNTIGAQYDFRWNWLQPPFDNPKIRRAALYAFTSKEFLEGVVGDPAYYRVCKAMFVCGTPLESTAGTEGLLDANFARSKELLKEAGYDGTPVVLLHTTDINVLTNAGPIAKSLLERGGFKVEMVPLDFQSIVSRRLRKGPPSEGGWSGFMTAWLSIDMMNPLTNTMVNASCDKAAFGWPCDQKVEQLRDAFARAPDLDSRRKIAADLQARALEVGTHVPLGQYTLPTATRGLTDIVTAPIPVFWNIDKP